MSYWKHRSDSIDRAADVRQRSPRSEFPITLRGEMRRLWNELSVLARTLVVLVVIGALAAAVILVIPPLLRCAEGVDRVDGQCVGVSDGADPVVFGEGFADVLAAIGAENQRIAESGRAVVSVAYLLPVPAAGTDADLAKALRHDLVGAYTAQRQANRTKTLGDEPFIRLLVANSGDSSAYWADEAVVPTLVGMARKEAFAEHHLVAVAITGRSLTTTRDAVDALLVQDVPVISARLTADQLTSRPPSADLTLARVAPTNSDQARAASAFLRPTAQKALIVQNSDENDTYTASLGKAFRASFPDATHQVERLETYSEDKGGVANTMRGILASVCAQKPDVVYFAGRAAALGALVQALPFRTCPELPINIFAGDDAIEFATAVSRGSSELRKGLEANASVSYTALAHPAAWRADPSLFAPGSTGFLSDRCPNCLLEVFPGENLSDGEVIIGYDAVLTAVRAIRSPYGINDTPDLVAQELKRIHLTESVPGASGWISLAPTGEAINKAVPVLRVQADGGVEFITLSSPAGTPCVPNVTPC